MRHVLALQHILATAPEHPALEIPSTAVTVGMGAFGIDSQTVLGNWQRGDKDESSGDEPLWDYTVDGIEASVRRYAIDNGLVSKPGGPQVVGTAVLDLEAIKDHNGDRVSFSPVDDIGNIDAAVRVAEAVRRVLGPDVEVGLWMPSPRGQAWERMEEQYFELRAALLLVSADPEENAAGAFDFVAHALYVNDPKDPSATPWLELDAREMDARNVLRLWDGVIPVRPMLWHRTELWRPGPWPNNPSGGRLKFVDPNLDSIRVMIEVFEAGGVKTVLWWDGSQTRTVLQDPEGLALSLDVLGLGEDDQEPPGDEDYVTVEHFDHVFNILKDADTELGMGMSALQERLSTRIADHERRLRRLEERPKRRGLRWPWGER